MVKKGEETSRRLLRRAATIVGVCRDPLRQRLPALTHAARFQPVSAALSKLDLEPQREAHSAKYGV